MSWITATPGRWPLTGTWVARARAACASFGEALKRHAHRRAGVEALAELDDRMLRDIGLTRAGIHAAVFGRPKANPGARMKACRRWADTM